MPLLLQVPWQGPWNTEAGSGSRCSDRLLPPHPVHTETDGPHATQGGTHSEGRAWVLAFVVSDQGQEGQVHTLAFPSPAHQNQRLPELQLHTVVSQVCQSFWRHVSLFPGSGPPEDRLENRRHPREAMCVIVPPEGR